MATNFVKGSVHTTQYTNGTGADISSGDVVVIAGTDAKPCTLGIAQVDIADGSSGTLAITGCWTLPKVSAAVIKQGESVNWDASEGAVDDNAATSAAGDVVGFGRADAAGAATTTSINIWIDQMGTYDAA